MLTIGIDPSTTNFGWGIVKTGEYKEAIRIDSGVIKPKSTANMPERIAIIARQFNEILQQHKPTTAAIETAYIDMKKKNGVIGVSQARGCAQAILGLYHIDLQEYAPTDIKKAIGLSGRASKNQVALFLQAILNYTSDKRDETDALAIACTGAFRKQLELDTDQQVIFKKKGRRKKSWIR